MHRIFVAIWETGEGPEEWTFSTGFDSINQSIMHFRVVQVIKSLQDPLEVGNNLPGINDNVRE